MPRNFAETFHDPIPWNIRSMDTKRWLLGMCKGHLWTSFECFWHLEDLEICCEKKRKTTTVFREFLHKLWYAKYNYTVGASKKSCLKIECILYSCLVLSNVLSLVDIPFLNGCEVVDSLSQVTCTTPSTWRCLKPVCLFTIPAVLRGDKKHGCLNTGVNTPYKQPRLEPHIISDYKCTRLNNHITTKSISDGSTPTKRTSKIRFEHLAVKNLFMQNGCRIHHIWIFPKRNKSFPPDPFLVRTKRKHLVIWSHIHPIIESYSIIFWLGPIFAHLLVTSYICKLIIRCSVALY